MPKTLYLPKEPTSPRSGIAITYTPSARRIDVSGWYDSCVGIEGASMRLGEFLRELGISEQDCRRELKQTVVGGGR